MIRFTRPPRHSGSSRRELRPAPRSNVSPTPRWTRSTTPSRQATISLCIFMLSITTSGCPSVTASPGETATVTTVPGIGAVATSACSASSAERSAGSMTSVRQGPPEGVDEDGVVIDHQPDRLRAIVERRSRRRVRPDGATPGIPCRRSRSAPTCSQPASTRRREDRPRRCRSAGSLRPPRPQRGKRLEQRRCGVRSANSIAPRRRAATAAPPPRAADCTRHLRVLVEKRGVSVAGDETQGGRARARETRCWSSCRAAPSRAAPAGRVRSRPSWIRA